MTMESIRSIAWLLLVALLTPATVRAQDRIAAKTSSVCALESGKRLESGAALPRKATSREIRELRTRLYGVAEATAERLATGRADALPEERFVLASSRYCVASRLEFKEALLTEVGFPKLDATEVSELSAGLKKALDPAIDQIADAHAPEEGQVCYFSTMLGRWICIEIFIDIDIDIDP